MLQPVGIGVTPYMGLSHRESIAGRDSTTVQSVQAANTADNASKDARRPPDSNGADRSGRNLSQEEQRRVTELRARDRQVRAHELAHKAAAGQYGGPVSYEYQVGPDGRRYAVGGEVSIDSSPVPGDPVATIQKMQVIARAALAPAQPSAQDRAVAMRAQQAAAEARLQILAEQIADGQEANSTDRSEGGGPYTEPSPIGQSIDTIL